MIIYFTTSFGGIEASVHNVTNATSHFMETLTPYVTKLIILSSMYYVQLMYCSIMFNDNLCLIETTQLLKIRSKLNLKVK